MFYSFYRFRWKNETSIEGEILFRNKFCALSTIKVMISICINFTITKGRKKASPSLNTKIILKRALKFAFKSTNCKTMTQALIKNFLFFCFVKIKKERNYFYEKKEKKNKVKYISMVKKHERKRKRRGKNISKVKNRKSEHL